MLCLVRTIRQSSSDRGSYLGLAGGGLARPGGVGAGDDLGGGTEDPDWAEVGGAGEAVLL